MQYGHLKVTLAAVVGLLLLTAPAGAQFFDDCEVCDDSDLTKPQCVDAEPTEMGTTDCTAPVIGFCDDDDPSGEPCWGDDPWIVRSFELRPDGTFAVAANASSATSLDGQVESVGAEVPGLSVSARIMERNCQGLILERLYGEAVTRSLALETERIII